MERKAPDYRKLRLGNIHTPEFRHLFLLLGWVVYFILYFVTENLIPADRCHVIHCGLDDRIPFCEWFVIPYFLWYGLVFGSLLYYLLKDVERFKQLQIFIMITQAVAMIFYIVYPSRQDLRPETFADPNLLTDLVGWLYSFDTNTGVFPSLHVAYSLGLASVWLKDDHASAVWKTFVVVMVVLICLSTCFIKQHSALDGFCAAGVSLIAEGLVFGKSYWLPKLRN